MKFWSFLGGVLSAGLVSTLAAQADGEICNDIPAYVTPDQKISTNLCTELKAKSDLDFLPIVIYFKREPAITDTVDPKKDTGKGISRPSDTATPPQYIEYTRQLFSSYDLRDLADSSRRLSIPEKVAGNYYAFATKKTILEINQATYIMNISLWDSRPAGVNHLRNRKNDRANSSLFDLTGRRIPFSLSKSHIRLRGFK